MSSKFKKKDIQDLHLPFANNPDILKALGHSKAEHQRLIGFAAETSADLMAAARGKLRTKNVDLMVANRIDEPQSGFAGTTNRVSILDRNERSAEMPVMSKSDIAWTIWDWILQL